MMMVVGPFIKFHFTRQPIALKANMIKNVTEIVPATEITMLLDCDAKFVRSGRIICILSDDCRVHTP